MSQKTRKEQWLSLPRELKCLYFQYLRDPRDIARILKIFQNDEDFEQDIDLLLSCITFLQWERPSCIYDLSIYYIMVFPKLVTSQIPIRSEEKEGLWNLLDLPRIDNLTIEVSTKEDLLPLYSSLFEEYYARYKRLPLFLSITTNNSSLVLDNERLLYQSLENNLTYPSRAMNNIFKIMEMIQRTRPLVEIMDFSINSLVVKIPQLSAFPSLTTIASSHPHRAFRLLSLGYFDRITLPCYYWTNEDFNSIQEEIVATAESDMTFPPTKEYSIEFPLDLDFYGYYWEILRRLKNVQAIGMYLDWSKERTDLTYEDILRELEEEFPSLKTIYLYTEIPGFDLPPEYQGGKFKHRKVFKANERCEKYEACEEYEEDYDY